MKNILTLLFILSTLTLAKEAAGDSITYRQNPNYIQEMGLYDIYKTRQADIVMFGNSITHGVKWNELLGRDRVIERGIASDNLEGMLSRMEYIFKLKPKVCFIMGGINDIYNWAPLEKIYQNYVRIVKELKSHDIKVVIQSTLLVASSYASSANRNIQVENLNKLLSDFSKQNGIDYIDLNSKLSKGKYLNNDYTIDGVHLNYKGYRIWGREIETVLAKLGL